MQQKIYFDLNLRGEKEDLKQVTSFIKKESKNNSSYKVASSFIGVINNEGRIYSLDIGMQNYGLSLVEGFDNTFFFSDLAKNFPNIDFTGTYKTDELGFKYTLSKGCFKEINLDDVEHKCFYCGKSILKNESYEDEDGKIYCNENHYREYLINKIINLNDFYEDYDFNSKDTYELQDLLDDLKFRE